MLALVLAYAVTQTDLDSAAKTVTITRDTFGIPHIRAKTDAEVVFGLMYAQAEDNYAQLEEDTAFGIGRASELVGQRGLGNDLRFRAFEIEKLAKAQLARSDRHFQEIAQAYADGLNYYLRKHPEIKSRIGPYEPWFFLANEDLPADVSGVSTQRIGIPLDSAGADLFASIESEEPSPDVQGSNGWAIARTRTESKCATLFINPHVNLFGRGQRYECHLQSKEGWDFSGFCILGNPIGHTGFNRHLGWTQTNTRAPMADAYRLQIIGETYKYGAELRPIATWEDSVKVLENGTLTEHRFRFEKTHLGPIVHRGNEAFAICLPLDRWMQFFPEKLAMSKAKNLDEFKKALAIGGLTYSNTTYADDKGNIAFWYGNTVPKRDPSFDWSGPVDGTDPRTAWQGFLTPDELPHVINPPSGFVQNCNSDPWHTTTGSGNPEPDKFPNYIVRDPDTARAKNSRRILGGDDTFSYERLAALAFDTQVYTEKERRPMIIAAVEADGATAAKYSAPLDALKAWDGRSSVDSAAATLYFETEAFGGGFGGRLRLSEDPEELSAAFSATVDRLTAKFGTWEVPWGKVNRLQRRQPFGADFPSWPCAGANSAFGQIFALSGAPHDGIRYGTMGDSYVALVEFGKTVRASAVCGFGQSADPTSPHFTDQAPLYAAGQFRPVWRTDSELKGHTERSYHPGA